MEYATITGFKSIVQFVIETPSGQIDREIKSSSDAIVVASYVSNAVRIVSITRSIDKVSSASWQMDLSLALYTLQLSVTLR
ncbi:hypothetical protein J6590_035352 [Homalodisca vitripennis]|nr:hypothetical protein J6590_035352 [Homalodisca vitripennis]